MEDVTLRDGRANEATVALGVEQVRSGLFGLARLHAAYWGRPLPEPLGFVRPWRLGPVWAPVSWASLARALHLLRSGGHGRLIPTASTPASSSGASEAGRGCAASRPRTLLHGDPHPGNTYALPGDVTGFYDWQLVRSGNWSHDVGYFLVSSLTTTDRQAYERDLLHDYLDELGSQEQRRPRAPPKPGRSTAGLRCSDSAPGFTPCPAAAFNR